MGVCHLYRPFQCILAYMSILTYGAGSVFGSFGSLALVSHSTLYSQHCACLSVSTEFWLSTSSILCFRSGLSVVSMEL